MDLNDILANAEDQEKGRWFELHDPVSGAPTGIKLKIAGPDSATQRRVQLAIFDEIAEVADVDGRVSAEARQRVKLNGLARCILDWEITEDGEPIPFNHKNVLRLLTAAEWIYEQADIFAGRREPYWGTA